MTIPKITPYSGGVANPDGSQTQTEFTQNMFDQLSYEAELSTELNNTVDGINDTATQVDADATSAENSANAAEAAASGLNYQGLWPDTGGIANKGDTYQTQVSGTPTGQYFTALQNTTSDPVGDDVNWRSVVSDGVLPLYTDIVHASIADMVNSTAKKAQGYQYKCSSYSDGWAATTEGPKGGGSFVFELGSSLDDKVVNFLASDGTGSFRRVSSRVEVTDCGARIGNTASENDVCLERLRAYCQSQNEGFSISGMYQINSELDTSGIQFINGENRDTDGFEMQNSAGKTAIKWRRPTKLNNIRILGGIANKAINDGSIGLDGFYFLNKASSIAVFGFGTGHKIHDAVSAFVDQITISGCHNAVELNGFEDDSAFSTTIGYSQATIQNNHNGIVGGSKGAFNTSVIGFNLNNTIFESNTNAGIIISNQEIGGVQYNSLDVRNLNFTGFAWFEGNGNYAYVLDKCLDVSFNCQVRNEQSQPTIYPSSSRVARRNAQDTIFGDDDQFCRLYRDGGEFGLSGFAAANYALMNLSTTGGNGDNSLISGQYQIRQDLDYSSAGRKSKHVWSTIGDSDAGDASIKMTLSRNGDMTISGNYSPFTGVHYFTSERYIATGLAVSGVNFDLKSVNIAGGDPVIVEGAVEITQIENDKRCLGVVDFSEKLEDGSWIVHVAAVGDNSTLNSAGAVVVGDWEVGDFLSTTADGRLQAYYGSDMRCVVLQSKGERDGMAYGYFK